MSSYVIIKSNKETEEITFLMANAVGTKTFKSDISNAWSISDHRGASDMMTKCINKHKDTDKFTYAIDDIDETGDW